MADHHAPVALAAMRRLLHDRHVLAVRHALFECGGTASNLPQTQTRMGHWASTIRSAVHLAVRSVP